MIEKSSIAYRKIKDRCFRYVIYLLAFATLVPLAFIFYYITTNGIAAINWDFFTKLPKPVGEIGGGVSNAITGSFMIVGIAAAIAIPWGICVGVYLYDRQEGKLAYWIRLSVEILQAIPSIVIGIVAYAWIVMPMKTFSALSGGIALGVMMLPMIIRATEETLKLVPKTLKEAALALGVPYYRTLFKVVVPSGLSGILTGVILAISRVMGETAPLLFTAFGTPFLAYNVLKPMNALPLVIFNYATSPYPDWHKIAWGASFVLMLFILSMNLLVKVISRKWKVKF